MHRLICLALEGTRGKKTLLAITKSMNSVVMKMKWRVSIQQAPLQMSDVSKLTLHWDSIIWEQLQIIQVVPFIISPIRLFAKKTSACVASTVLLKRTPLTEDIR